MAFVDRLPYDPRDFPGIVDARTVLGPVPTPDGPRSLSPDAPEHELVQYWRYALDRWGRSPVDNPIIVKARIDWGRWLADCPVCTADAVLCVPGFTKSCCLGCGNVFPTIFPEARERARAEKILAHRTVPWRNWDPLTQTVSILADWNEAQGLPRK